VSTSTRPVPVPDERSAPYWEAAARHVLTIARCSRCNVFSHPPDDICLNCGSIEPNFVFTPVSGRGTIKSWTIVRQALLPGFEKDVPYLTVDVELEEQKELRIIGRLLDGPNAKLKLGAPVHVQFEDIAPGISVPAFKLGAKS
jgi:uncharacterized OB-fold protein